LKICCDGCCDFWVTGWLFWWVAVGSRWAVVWIVVGGGCGGRWRMWWLEFFFFYIAQNTVKYFSEHFPECNQTSENKQFSLKSFAFANILRWKIFYSEINEALMMSRVFFSTWFVSI
jgi:hypothetical protein